MRYLESLDLVVTLDSSNCFSTADTHTLFGRAAVAARLVPIGAAACTYLARWIWAGGAFPGTIDIISQSHYRAAVHGHLIRVHNRHIEADQMIQIGSLFLTSPARTACDLACNEDGKESFNESVARITSMLELYDVRPEECMDLLLQNQRWPGHAKGLEIMRMIVLATSELATSDGTSQQRTHGNHKMKGHQPSLFDSE